MSDRLKQALLTLLFLVLGCAGLEVYVDRWDWGVAESWYRLEESDERVLFACQNYAPVVFTPEPAEGVTRILALGGSTTFGFPEHPKGEDAAERSHGFVGMLEASLQEAWPGRYEIVNLGINGGGSTDALRLMRRAGGWGATALVLYDGHNEFMNVPASFPAGLWRFALFRRFAVLGPRVEAAPGTVGPAAYGGADQRAAIVGLFRSNVGEILDLADDYELRVVVSTQAANLAGFDPNWDIEGEDSAAAAFEAGDYRRAADLDALPFRAPSEINEVLRELAAEREVVLADAEAAVGTEGDNEDFYDWVHPRPTAAERIAEAVLQGLVQAEVLPSAPPLVRHELSDEEAAEAELRTARAWLTWSCVRAHDPKRRLAQTRWSAQRVLELRPSDPEAQGILAAADALDGGSRGEMPDEVRERLSSLHACVADAIR